MPSSKIPSILIAFYCAVSATQPIFAQSNAIGNVATNSIGKAGQAGSGSGFLGGIFGCNASGSKQVIGAAGGGAVGGFLGNRIAGKGSRTLGTVAGAAVGAAAGSAIGCKLQRSDQAKAERAAQQAAATNKSQSWTNEETGASGRVDVASGESGVSLDRMTLEPSVQPADGYSRVGRYFVATSNANIRNLPSLDGQILGQLTAGQRVWVPASATGTDWLLIANGTTGQGYVSSSLLRTTATARAGCKLIKQSVSTPDSPTESENLEACRSADGNWVLRRV